MEQQRQAGRVAVRRQAEHLAGLPARRVVVHPHVLGLASEYLQERLRINAHVHGQELQQAACYFCRLQGVPLHGIPT
ncbi:Os10g0558301 [Oryza sativa Japonica Group]|uniref:Os10g0558301 protein n=1 Tax=Oryza sativa subsp. japonica TaxID=39947 RepID=A0A0P0XXH5_ORYSJ|nr:hypothetical protein EE612_052734 [Oryza sativa]BAT12016.1 Os10g0558301 [Oryza sativa Japonica Group]